jgi:hypothetical protein
MATQFQATQSQFAAYIRDPENNAKPADVDHRRMAMYRELFFNNIDSFIASNFPVLRTILNDAQWLELTQDFFARHRCETPYFSEIAEEFLAYLQNERNNPDDYPFLLELAHYEWVEMALSIAKDTPVVGSGGFLENLLSRRIALSPLAWPLLYRYPVQAIGPGFLPREAPEQPSCLIVYRDENDQVHFLKTTGLTIRLLQIFQDQGGMSGESCLQAVAAEFPQLDVEALMSNGLPILRELAEKGILIPAVDA